MQRSTATLRISLALMGITTSALLAAVSSSGAGSANDALLPAALNAGPPPALDLLGHPHMKELNRICQRDEE